ncbi:23S rRNA (uracil(1939)-C(5))-methyltransferase RlmD [Edaphobacter sp. 12200R-103]|uniref:23S rRNA (uracil(1939)-C(5))-methyltransferase RlmD n=1 Tax=Edaphobacter sp. 12200R-103 TaxID=2703788 RepID=UPI00138C675F|nr:23S rRNA (uracil(1939)-C(5))-methyltransferase RlmD [Edaphobacter sp. 12200R-103]QHS52049.1 23S rRNA (uracil(1939)-C(5))-methyltransferase RlmD [Edaphobacter sp. 12200R-103]
MKLSIEKVVYSGAGLARRENATGAETVFVPFTLPGEVVEAEMGGSRGGITEATLTQILTASPNRIEARCIHFGVCGGCQYQHAAYEAQLELKRGILKETLKRAGLHDLPEIETCSAQPWEYRNRIRLRVDRVDSRLRAGYVRRNSGEFLPIEMCPIAAPVLWRAAQALLECLDAFPQWATAIREVEFFATGNERKLQITLIVAAQPAKNFEALCAAVQEKTPELAGAGVQILQGSTGTRKAQRTKTGAEWGAEGLSYKVDEESYWVGRGNFFQVNRSLVTQLVRLATEGRGGRLAWDLYAGVGLFSRVLARNFDEVVAVEAQKGSLEANLRGPGKRAAAATTADFLRQAALERDRPELIVMDPPRAGVGAEVCSLLARVKAPELVYISCDPVTLGRDLRMMVDSGYKVNQLHLVDMFPQTFHQETVAVLGR